jgi:hypothetical protein
MPWYFGMPLSLVLSVGFWAFLDAYHQFPKAALFSFEPGELAGYGAWFCGIWAGMSILATRYRQPSDGEEVR